MTLIWLKFFRSKLAPNSGMNASKIIIGRCLVAICAALLSMEAAIAQDIAAGAEVARTQCSGCHQIGPRSGMMPGLAPSFEKVAATKGMTQTSIEVFLSTPHEAMPNYTLSEMQIDNVAAYIMSLHGVNEQSLEKADGRTR